MNMKNFITIVILCLCSIFSYEAAWAQQNLISATDGLPALTIKNNSDTEQTYSLSLQILALMTGLTLLPSMPKTPTKKQNNILSDAISNARKMNPKLGFKK